LKPSNILLDGTGQPRITDFGLARRVEKDSFLTITGQVLGSPNFMPPEQAGTKSIKAGYGAGPEMGSRGWAARRWTSSAAESPDSGNGQRRTGGYGTVDPA
jgi:serine/threonine protein kinase